MFYVCKVNSTLLEGLVVDNPLKFDNIVVTDEKPNLGKDVIYKVVASKNNYLSEGDVINIHTNNLIPVGNDLDIAMQEFNK